MRSLTLLVPSFVAVIVLVGLSAFFSSSESAILSLSDQWIDSAAGDGARDSQTLRLR
ncbi:hypothetical protein [Halonotius sp. F2-221B]|uniref:hypothetical protein n=1 Tax=Halonotius sp. F2-221B TaxID=2731620 RepID=UPI00398B14E2